MVHKSTDLVMKVTDFDTVSSNLVGADVMPLVKAALLKDGVIVTQSTDLGFDVLKICDGREKSVSEVDVGIVRCVCVCGGIVRCVCVCGGCEVCVCVCVWAL